MFEKLVSVLTDEQLQQAYYEIKEFRKTGILNNGVLRMVHKQFEYQTGNTDYPVHGLEAHFLFEIAKRKYE